MREAMRSAIERMAATAHDESKQVAADVGEADHQREQNVSDDGVKRRHRDGPRGERRLAEVAGGA